MSAELTELRNQVESLRTQLADHRENAAALQAQMEMAQREEARFDGTQQELQNARAIRERSREAIAARMENDMQRKAEQEPALEQLRAELAAEDITEYQVGDE